MTSSFKTEAEISKFQLLVPAGIVKPIINLFMAFTLLIGLSVIVGWWAGIDSLVQIHEDAVPMQFNTALCFLGISVSALAIFRKAYRFSAVVCSVVFVIALLTLIQYLFNLDFGVDQLFHQHEITTQTSHPGRMAPNTAVCFLLSAAFLFWLSVFKVMRRSLVVIGIVCGLVLAIGTVSILGYLLDIETSYGWGKYTHMSLQTAIGFSFFSLASLAYVSKKSEQRKSGSYQLTLLTGSILLSVTVLFTNAVNLYQNQKIQDQLETVRYQTENEILHEWRLDLLKLVNALKDLKNWSQRSGRDYFLPEALVAASSHDESGTVSFAYAKSSTVELESLIRDLNFNSLPGDRVTRQFNVLYSELFLHNQDYHFFLELTPFEMGQVNQKLPESHYLLFNYNKWIENYVQSSLKAGVALKPKLRNGSVVMPEQLNNAKLIDLTLPLPFKKQQFQLAVSTDSIQGLERLVELVFWIGFLVTLAITTIVYLAQKSSFKSKLLQRQIEENHDFQKELMQSNLTIKLATEVANLGIWSWDVDTGKLNWNQQMFEIYETPDEVIESGLFYDYWYKSVHPDDKERASSTLAKAVEEKRTWSEEFRLLLDNDRIKYIRANAICTIEPDSGHLIVIGGNVDITEETQLLQELKTKTELAEKNTLAKSHFLANMSHEIRTPMNAILGIGDLMQGTHLDPKQYEYMKLIMSSAQKLLDLLNDILDLSKIEAGEMKIESLSFPLEEVIADSLKSLSTVAHQKGLDYHFFSDPNLPIWVFSDPTRLSQIIINLVNNAIKFTEKGEINVSLSLNDAPRVSKDVAVVDIRVKDTGLGIESSKLSKLFKAFSQADESTTRKYGGTGLGLSIVKELVNLLGGTIDIKSELGKGTEVIVTLPFKLDKVKSNDDSVSEDFQYFLKHSNQSLKAINCLVIDNHGGNRQWLTDMLHSWNCNVTPCDTAECAFEAIKNYHKEGKRYHCMLVERDLEEMDGFEFIAQVKKLSNNLGVKPLEVVVMLSASELQRDLEACRHYDVKEHLVKPVKQSEVFNALVSVLGMRETDNQKKHEIGEIEKAQSLQVLVAEDHPVNQFLIKEILDKRGHQCLIVENGSLAVQAIKDTSYDAIIMDVQMPVMDGIEATKAIRSGMVNNDVCIIGLTARALKEDVAECLQAGMDYYLTKPVNPKELLQVLENDAIRNVRKKVLIGEAESAEETKGVEADSGLSKSNEVASSFQIFNEEHALFTTANDRDLLNRVLRLTLSEIEIANDEMRLLIEQENWDALSKRAHKTKGMVSNFSVSRLTEELELVIEKLGMQQIPEAINLLEGLIVDIKRLKEEIERYLAQATTQGD